ncbi:ileal sodium/bile acid cotransporter-like isoform X2 [Arctopsyche grandis]|uniref:ileal sodium/bile acid cotransporter-like isoform X2 n=1 Tax=Arctopsyche grandis TaxID=121162 RepID=UPI00406D8A90
MCPVWPLHIIFFYLLTIIPVWVVCQTAPKLMTEFNPSYLEVHMDETKVVKVNISDFKNCNNGDNLFIKSDSEHISSTDYGSYQLKEEDLNSFIVQKFNVTGNFLGKTKIRVVSSNAICSNTNEPLEVIVTRKERIIDRVFTGSVATLVSIIYINFGCAMDWATVKATIKRPFGPAIGFFGQFLFMPLISYGFGVLLFPNDTNMQLGMFFTGVSPGGGASNIWTYVLGGNLNLSITMTTISTLAAFGMMPLWLFTLGRSIFKSGDLGVPYYRIAGFAVGLVIPLGLGLLAQRYLPRFAKLMVRILKTFSALLLLFIIVFAIVTNLYLFELFSWQIIVAGMCVPWLGYMVGYVAATLLKQPPGDCLAIALETGIQNTGISIFLLRFSLSQPEADLTTVIPVSIAIMTPLPMICLYLYQVLKRRCSVVQEYIIPSTMQETVPLMDCD